MSATRTRREALERLGLLGVAALAAACSAPQASPTTAPTAVPPAAPKPTTAPAPASPAVPVAAASPSAAASSSGAAQAATGAPLVVGVTYPLTGPLAAFGTQVLPSIQIAVDDLNKKGGVKGQPLQLVVEDTKSTPEGGVAAMQKVVQVNKVPVVITIFTNVVTAQIPLAEQVKVPLMSPVEAPGVLANTKWAFSYAPSFDHNLPLLVDHWKKIGLKRLFAFFPDNAIAEFYSPPAKDGAKQAGATYDEARYKLGETDYRGIAARARDFNPDGILINGQGTPDDGVLIRQLREIGVNAQIYLGSNNFNTESWRTAVGQLSEGMIFAGFVIDQQKAKTLVDAYKAKTGIDPSQVNIQVYDQVNMVAYAIDKGGYNGQGIRDALASLKGVPSINGGTIEMGADNQARPPVGLFKIQNQTVTPMQPGG